MMTQTIIRSLSVLLISQGQAFGQGDTCPKNFKDVLSTHGRCLLLVKDSITWYQARDQCLDLGGDLVLVDSASMAKTLATMVNELGVATYWIGLNDILVNDDYYWNDGTAMTWSFWGSYTDAYPQPNDNSHDQNCVIGDTRSQMLVPNQWQDKSCSDTSIRGFICQLTPENGSKMRLFNERLDLSKMLINVEVTSTINAGSKPRCAALCVLQPVCDGFFYKAGTCDLLKLNDITKIHPEGRGVFVAAGTGKLRETT